MAVTGASGWPTVAAGPAPEGSARAITPAKPVFRPLRGERPASLEICPALRPGDAASFEASRQIAPLVTLQEAPGSRLTAAVGGCNLDHVRIDASIPCRWAMRKDVREFIRRLEAVGLTIEATPGHYHVLRDGKPLRKANGMPMTLPFSPSTTRWRRTAILDLRKLGIDV